MMSLFLVSIGPRRYLRDPSKNLALQRFSRVDRPRGAG